MSKVNIIRAWKDEAYRNSLSEAELASLPANPAGVLELADADLADVNGGLWTVTITIVTVLSSHG